MRVNSTLHHLDDNAGLVHGRKMILENDWWFMLAVSN